MNKIILILSLIFFTSSMFSQKSISKEQYVYFTVDTIVSYDCDCSGVIVKQVGTTTIGVIATNDFKESSKCSLFIDCKRNEYSEKSVTEELTLSTSSDAELTLSHDYRRRKRTPITIK